ncbi:probable LRR receptor-like serine/threonine-protein kinase At1g56140 [Tripterygium wilfordii]|uniref:probable LRR receptor-like serine/threonine-protein kinase At1g56140 n=1 Tax=Tripterygium wilfordii TaxID=458696 RepID=UPI0018F7ECFE|nr:probable LRR receptor-like serine/threonine-protein kinase At1g56140 [Tripterygium wilfordii]
MLWSRQVWVFGSLVAGLLLLGVAQAQNRTQPTTDANDARIVNSIFQRWGIKANQNQWNISGEPCSGDALDTASATIDDGTHNPFIKCTCSFNNGSTCRVSALKVYALDVVGAIPDVLWNLTYLTNLNLAQNYLTGPLPSTIGNLIRMQYLSIGINALSGELPKELGLLTDLRSFGFGTNNFSGPLPSELGNLLKLEQIYFDSAGVSGKIPSTFANLQNMVIVWASDNNLTGRIPDFIGNWTKLTTLRFQGNSFEGPIPSTFSNLTALTELRISDISNGGSSLAFMKNMKSLTILELRNDNISDSIPSDIGEYPSLTQLDLSFNRIIGPIPDSLFNLGSLTHLFLGNNALNETLPVEKSSSLSNIDVSYNNLMGSLPSWVSNENLQLNLVANNFMIKGSKISGLPSGLICLQKNFPCNRGRGRYYNFAIKCGGPQITSSNGGTVYERDNETLGPANYFVTDTNRWAVSNVGLFAGISSQSTDSLDSELFQTARVSPSSLRYYGLGLENGNYIVNLQFAEISIDDSTTWKGLGRRLFDIYIQGNRVLQDFDIKKEAGGVSNRAVLRNFTAQVTENYLEIHLFWAGKGTCCIPSQGTYGPSISAISATPDFIPTVSNIPPGIKIRNNRTGLIVGVVLGVGAACLLALFFISFIVQRKRRQAYEDEELMGIDTKPYTFSYAELKTATEDFNPSSKLGEGEFGPVYKGKLNDGRLVAVKQLSVRSHHGKSQFVAEIATISAVQHRNLVKLCGCCIEVDRRLLVYEYMENKSLDQALFGKTHLKLDWPTRYNICLGIARGLAYLHEESRLRIVHRDVKASNILLDSNLVPKISDFGLAKLYDDNKTHISTRIAGTIGYLAPEYAMRGHLTEKADVFAFGVVALEIISGRPNSDSSLDAEKAYLLDWAWQLHETNREFELVDSNLLNFDEEEVKRMMGVGLLCTQASPHLRPSMSRAMAMISGDIEVSTVTSRPGYFMNENATQVSNGSHYNSLTSTNMVANALGSPGEATTPMLTEIIGR